MRLDPARHEVHLNGGQVLLPLKEFELLELLMGNAGRVLTRETLIDRIWGPHYVGDTKTLDVHVKRLRAKIEDDPARPARITTIRGLGYKFEALRVATAGGGQDDGVKAPPRRKAPNRPLAGQAVGQVDPGQPQPGRVQLGRRRELPLRAPQPVEPFGAGPLDDAAYERLPSFVAGFVERHPEHLAQDLGPAGLFQTPPAQGLGQRAVGADEPPADAIHDVVDVAGDGGQEGPQGHLEATLLVVLQLAEQGLGIAERGLQGGHVGGIELAQPVFQRLRIGLEGADIVADQAVEPSLHVRAAEDGVVGRLPQAHPEPDVVGGQAPVRGEGVDGDGHQHELVPAGTGHGQVVLAQGPVSQLTDHRSGLHPEQEGPEHLRQIAEQLGHGIERRAPVRWSGAPVGSHPAAQAARGDPVPAALARLDLAPGGNDSVIVVGQLFEQRSPIFEGPQGPLSRCDHPGAEQAARWRRAAR